jgi:hypothetical protein
VRDEPRPILRLLQAIAAIDTALWSLVFLGIGIAFVVMGHMAGKLVGIGLLVLWLCFVVSAMRRFTNRSD